MIAAATLLSGVSALGVIPASDALIASRPGFKVDRLATRADTGVRNYLSPRLNGKPVAFCLSSASQCGKEAADAFCRENGFAEALTFRRDSVQSDPAKLRFGQIKCWHPQVAVDADVIIELAGAAATSNLVAKSGRL